MSTTLRGVSKLLLPAHDIRRTDGLQNPRVRKGLEQFLHSLHGVWQRRAQRLRGWGDTAQAAVRHMETLRDESPVERSRALKQARCEVRRQSARQQFPDISAETLARLGLSAEDRLGMRPYPEQLIGVLGLIEGNLMEMATGEGKTLTLALAAVIAAWRGRPVHVVTANDYLARRDASNLLRFFMEHQVSVSAVLSDMEAPDRRKHYQADVVYTTAKELVADFLRDRLQLGEMYPGRRRNLWSSLLSARSVASVSAAMVQRGFGTVWVDEADHVLIDEAATPLIISRKKENELLQEAVRIAADWAAALIEGEDFRLRAQFRDVELLAEGERKIELRASRDLPKGILRQNVWRMEWVRQALIAKYFFERDRQYVILNDKLLLIDEGTGRQMPERSWRQGLHQAIEAKEGLPFTPSTEVLASISFQRFFRRMPHLGGVTGTAHVNRAELWRVYRLAVFRVPTHRPVQRRMHKPQITLTADEKWQSVADLVVRLHALERPVLIGTRSVAASHALAAQLERRDLPFALLNAVRNENEATIIAEAGGPARITIATNMAGRGTDILVAAKAREQGGLVVIATEKHEARRIDLQLFGRCARQGEPGEVHSWLSLEDEIFVRHLPAPCRRLIRIALRAGIPGARAAARLLGVWVQRRAEWQSYRQRLKVLRQDRWLEESLGFGDKP